MHLPPRQLRAAGARQDPSPSEAPWQCSFPSFPLRNKWLLHPFCPTADFTTWCCSTVCFKALIEVIEKGLVPTDSPGREDAGHLLDLYPSADWQQSRGFLVSIPLTGLKRVRSLFFKMTADKFQSFPFISNMRTEEERIRLHKEILFQGQCKMNILPKTSRGLTPNSRRKDTSFNNKL